MIKAVLLTILVTGCAAKPDVEDLLTPSDKPDNSIYMDCMADFRRRHVDRVNDIPVMVICKTYQNRYG